MTSLLDFCDTPREREIVGFHLQNKNSMQIAVALGLKADSYIRAVIRNVTSRAEDRGFDPVHHRNHVMPAQQIISGYSDLVRYPKDDPLGRVVGWIKSNRKLAAQVNDARTMLDAMVLDIPQAKPVIYSGNQASEHTFTVIPIGDPHIGLRTWSREVGVEWDVEIALRVYRNVFTRLFSRTPDTHTAVLFNSGDMFHADNVAGETTRSRNKLDMDGRPAYWIHAGFSFMRMLVEMALQKYERVVFVNTPGNHDDVLGLATGSFIHHLYEQDHRLICLRGENPFQYFTQGNVALGFCHGHTCKLPSLPGKMADDRAVMWGQTTLRHWFTGHVHHNQWQQWKEHPGCTVESVGIIPPKDAYAHGAGYGANRGTQLVLFDDRGYALDRYQDFVLPDD